MKVNSQLSGLTQNPGYDSLLAKFDEMAGIISHGLLKERAKMTEGMRTLAQKYPDAYNDIKDLFLGSSSFKEISDDLLHFTCARRAEIIEMRRKLLNQRTVTSQKNCLKFLLQRRICSMKFL